MKKIISLQEAVEVLNSDERKHACVVCGETYSQHETYEYEGEMTCPDDNWWYKDFEDSKDTEIRIGDFVTNLRAGDHNDRVFKVVDFIEIGGRKPDYGSCSEIINERFVVFRPKNRGPDISWTYRPIREYKKVIPISK